MALNNARRFVEKLKQDQNFRKKALATTEPDDLLSFLQEEGLPFNQRELVEAMAECMEELKLQMGMDRSRWESAFYRQIAQADPKYTDEIQTKYNAIHQPVLILWAEDDKWIPVEQAHSLHQLIPNSKLVTVPQTGHLVIEERPEILIREIKGFLNKPNEV